MKNLTFIILAILLLASCSGEGSWPDDLSGKKELLTEKKKSAKKIAEDIERLKKEIIELDPPTEKEPVLVTTTPVELQDFERYTQVQASVVSDDQVYASSETGGRITTMTVDEGQYVKKGQLIATVDMQSVRDQKAEVETGMSLAKDVYDRQKRLWDQNIGTEIQYLQAKNNYERLQKSITLLNTQLAKANVYSPISGVVDMKMLQAGEMAGPGAPIVQIFNPNKLKIVADVPESYLTNIKRGQQVKINFPALDVEMTKSISTLGRTIDPSNRTFKVEIVTNSLSGKLKPNLLADISFVDFAKKDAITVPLDIVLEEVSGRKYVYSVISKNGTLRAHKEYVTISESYLGSVIIEEGLKSGDDIIIDGARSVINGDPVKIIEK